MKKNNQKSQIIIYKAENGQIKIDVRFEAETVWLTQNAMGNLFQTTKQNIGQHIKNILEERELSENLTVKKFFTVQKEGSREVSREIEYYNLDLIISVGYRVKSNMATAFRQWATARLREYIIKGFVLDDERLKGSGGGQYWAELIHSRADAERDFMGLTTFVGALPVRAEVGVAKNYLTEDELFRLNRMVSAFFDLAEIKAQEHTPMRMADWVKELDKFAKNYGKGVLHGAGGVSHTEAMKKARQEYLKYQAKTLSPVEGAYLESIKTLDASSF